jgi:hypothetical protein
MKAIKRIVGPGVLVAALLLAGCQNPPAEPTPAATLPPTTETTTVQPTPPEATPTATLEPAPTAEPVSEADIEASLATTRDFLARLSTGDYRAAYGALLTIAGQERLADLVLGRLALADPHISYFELLGAQPDEQRIAVDVLWRETFEGQGEVGSQEATVLLLRQNGRILIDDVILGSFTPAATPVPPSLPRAETLVSPAVAGQEMRFRAAGFQVGETVLAWLELADGTLLDPLFGVSDSEGVVEVVYPGDETSNLPAGRWIWWAQALRDSARNTGITFDVEAAPAAAPTPTSPPAPTQAPARPTPAPAATAVPAAPTATPAPSTAYGPPTLIWPEPVTERSFGSALIVEFVPVAAELAADEYYELVVTGKTDQGTIFSQGSVLGKGDACQGVRNTPCVLLIASERFMDPFHRGGSDSRGEWFVQVVRQTGADQYTPISPPSEVRVVTLKPRS